MGDTGRPSDYSDEVADFICDEIAKGKNLARICKSPKTPCRTTIYEWLKEYPEFMNKYVIAKRMQLFHMVDEVIELADECRENAPDKVTVMATTLQINTRKWYISKVAPKMPSLTGSHVHQARQIISSYCDGDLNEEHATTLMRLLECGSTFVPLDNYKEDIATIKESLSKLKNPQASQ